MTELPLWVGSGIGAVLIVVLLVRQPNDLDALILARACAHSS